MTQNRRNRFVSLQNVSRVQANTKNLSQTMAKGKLKQLASLILLTIVNNANKGLNCDNKKMKPYSAAYQKRRKKEGLNTTPNFQYSSNMIRSLQIFDDKLEKLEISIGVSGVDKNGMPNVLKLKYVQGKKNYLLLKWSKYLSKIVADFFNGARR